MKHVKVSIYVNEAEQWQHQPLYLELLNILQKHDIAGGTVLRGVAGLTRDGIVKTSLFHISKKLPLVVQFIDKIERVKTVLPEIKKIVPHHLIVRLPVEVLNGDER